MTTGSEWSTMLGGWGAPLVDTRWHRLATLWHSTHLGPTLRIAEDRMISGGLIYDGKLRETRTEVIYFSPTSWTNGSRYGAFQFEIDWGTLIAGRRLYWVETLNNYEHRIYRFLISGADVSHLPVTLYDPERDGGPIRKIGDAWYWASGYAAEVVIDEAVPVHDLTALRFERHHNEYCSDTGISKCPERGFSGSWNAHSLLIAALLGRGLKTLNDLLLEEGNASNAVSDTVHRVWKKLILNNPFAGPVADNDLALDVMASACLVLHGGDAERAKRMANLIDGEARADAALMSIIRSHFGLPDFTWDRG